MPLVKSDSKKAVSENIKTEMAANKPQRQAIAIALDVARRSARANGGRSPAAFGGMQNPPWYAREEERGASKSYGLVGSSIPGRTDRHPVDVPAGTYVLPADVVSGLGEDNTLAGAKIIDQMMSTNPYGIRGSQIRHGSGPPRPPTGYASTEGVPPFAKGGATHQNVPIIIAGGEFLIDPDKIAHHPMLGNLDPAKASDPEAYQAALKNGHNILDEFVKQTRKKKIKTLQKLPGPKK